MSNKSKYKRVVIKIGSSSLTHSETGKLNFVKIEHLVRELSDLHNQGIDVCLVSSGAIAVGRAAMGIKERPSDISTKQACAAVGQAKLMMVYQKLFAEYNQTAGQVLMTKNTMVNPVSRENAKNTFDELFHLRVIPVVNENDTVAIDELELEVGENDSLAANVATIANADLLVIMSDIDGLYDKDPHVHENANLIPEVGEITDDIRSLAGGAGSALGTGGMATKIKAVEIAHAADIDVVLMNGKNPHKLYDLFEDKPVGTLFAKTL